MLRAADVGGSIDVVTNVLELRDDITLINTVPSALKRCWNRADSAKTCTR
ncbi:hypothetical protein [Pseudomonas sp. B21-053]